MRVNLSLVFFVIAIIYAMGDRMDILLNGNAFRGVIYNGLSHQTSSTSTDTLNLQDILGKISNSLNCDLHSWSNCSSHVLSTKKTVTNITEWNQFSTQVVYFLLNTSDCKNSRNPDLNYEQTLADLLIENSTIDEEVIHHLLIHLMNASHTDGKNIQGCELRNENTGSKKCFNGDVLMHYMGAHHNDKISADRLPELLGHIVSFIVQGWRISESCAMLPSPAILYDSLFKFLEGGSVITDEGFEKILKTLNLIRSNQEMVATADPHAHEGHGHDHHGHAHKRAVEEHAEATSQCLSEESWAAIFNLDLTAGITKEQFLFLCPTLIQQRMGNFCEVKPTKKPNAKKSTIAQAYGYGTLAVLVISLLSLTGGILIPCIHQQAIRYVLHLFLALGIGTMLCDAVLHLIPEAILEHAHSETRVSESSQKLIVLLAAIYAFYLYEALSAKFSKGGHGHSHGGGHSHSQNTEAISITSAVGDKGEAQNGKPKSAWEMNEQNSYASSNGSSLHTEEVQVKKRRNFLTPYALMILLGDIIHNFIDGIAIGAAFSLSPLDGLMTTIAVFCHEIPHELANFSLLLTSGLDKWKALLLNFGCDITNFIGCYIGIALGTNENATKWLLALTAGMFLYVSLVVMVPEIVHRKGPGKWWIYFLLENLGLFIGFAIMLLISAYGEELGHRH